MKRRVVKVGNSLMIVIPSKFPFREGQSLNVRYKNGQLIYSLGNLPVSSEPVRQPEPHRESMSERERDFATISPSPSQPETKEDPISEGFGNLFEDIYNFFTGKKRKKREPEEETI